MDGIILINKEKDYTSHDVVAKVKKMLKVKVGHTGTLDPNATGVLPLLLGNATKVSKYLINHDKEYIAELKLGIKTDTADGEGKVIAEKKVDINELLNNKSLKDNNENINSEREDKKVLEEKLQEILNSFVGKMLQKPPMYSAIKINGKKLYEYARKNQKVEVEPREIEIYNIKLINFDTKENIIKFKVNCSKGTYIRTLCENISEKLNTYGYMKELQRTKVGNFCIENAITIEELEKIINEQIKINSSKENDNINKNIIENKIDIDNNKNFFITIEKLFENNENFILNQDLLDKFLNGVMIKNNKNDGIYKVYIDNKFIGIGINKEKRLKRDIII